MDTPSQIPATFGLSMSAPPPPEPFTAPVIVNALKAIGFTVLDQIAELGVAAPIPGCTYLYRNHGTVAISYQYVSVLASPFDAALHLETVIEVYHCLRARKACPGGLASYDRMARGFSPVYTMIRRDLSLILSDLDAPHPLPPRPTKRS